MSLVGGLLSTLSLVGACVCAFLALVVLVGGAWWVLAPDAHDQAVAEDRKDPKKAWVHGVGMLLMEGTDYAYLPDDRVEATLEDWWNIEDLGALEATVADLNATRTEIAWNVARTILLLRAAVSVGWIDNPKSWKRCLRAGVRLQEAYPTWEAMADDLVASRRRWRELPADGSGDTDDMRTVLERVAAHEKDLWKKVSWLQPLE